MIVTYNDMIQTKHEIQTRCEEIQGYLEITCSEEVAEIQDRGNTLSVYMAQSGKMLADAKYHRDQAVKNSVIKNIAKDLPASTLNKLVDADCEDENYLVNWCERINRTCTHQMEWARSMISKAKEEMRFQNFGT